jgi:hypothetical protein
MVVVLVALGVFFVLCNRASLDNSIGIVGKMLDVSYEIQRQKIGHSITDLSAVWEIRSNDGLTEKIADKAPFARADDSDLKFFRQLVVDAFGSGEKLDGYALYRAKVPLGEGTICTTLPCSIYVLVKAGSPLAYIGIYKS